MSAPTIVFVKGRRTRVRIEGDPGRRPVVLLHGIGRSLEDWGPQYTRLARTHRVIALDCCCPGQWSLGLTEAPIPRPGPGEVLVRTLASGICGSDLHTAQHGAELVAGVRAVSGVELFELDEAVVIGHEFCAEVVDYGPNCRRTLASGTRVVSVPLLLRPQPVMIGLSGVETPGAYAE